MIVRSLLYMAATLHHGTGSLIPSPPDAPQHRAERERETAEATPQEAPTRARRLTRHAGEKGARSVDAQVMAFT